MQAILRHLLSERSPRGTAFGAGISLLAADDFELQLGSQETSTSFFPPPPQPAPVFAVTTYPFSGNMPVAWL